MSGKVFICDFNDSFTFNIFSILKENANHIDIEVIPFKPLLNFFQVMEHEESKAVIILGPGPGHPKDYHYLYTSLKKLIIKKNFFLMGICLGHQILWEINGAETDYCRTPVHGHVAHYILENNLSEALGIPKSIFVQRYNSLAVKLSKKSENNFRKNGWKFHIENSELIISQSTNIVTYQFHPESIGTTCPKAFFRPVLQFLL